jgi:exodeoxyribonuclease V beta subunit
MAFYYPFPVPGPVPAFDRDDVMEIVFEDGFMRGFVDLIFQWRGKFYIADWKSNTLETGYDRDSMEVSMAQSRYPLQYRLYCIATLRWLKQAMGKRFNPEKHFGGVFYFYLRGMKAGEQTGIYYVPPKELGTLERIERETREMMV